MRKNALIRTAALAAVGLTAVPASAGSLKDTAPAPIWTGFYAGVHAGHGWTELDGERLYEGEPSGFDDRTNGDIDGNGFLGGGQVGYNVQDGPWVFGVEGDWAWSNVDGEHSDSSVVFDSDQQYHKVWDFELEHFGTLRARAGHSFGPTMLYLTGGLAWGKLSSDLTSEQEVFDADGESAGIATSTTEGWDDTLIGWTIGGGVEAMLGDRWSAKAEYLYADLGDADISYGGAFKSEEGDETFDSDFDIHTIRVGVNYKVN